MTLREDQPVNLCGAFERAVPRSAQGYAAPSKAALAQYAQQMYSSFAEAPAQSFTVGSGLEELAPAQTAKAVSYTHLACDLVDEGMITEQEAVLRVEPKQLDTLLHPQFDAAALKAAEVVGKGLAASPGSACGQIVFTAEEAEEMVKSGKMKKVVLVRLETSLSLIHIYQMPEVYDQFVEIATRLENYFRDMQDMEFTIEDGHLYICLLYTSRCV